LPLDMRRILKQLHSCTVLSPETISSKSNKTITTPSLLERLSLLKTQERSASIHPLPSSSRHEHCSERHDQNSSYFYLIRAGQCPQQPAQVLEDYRERSRIYQEKEPRCEGQSRSGDRVPPFSFLFGHEADGMDRAGAHYGGTSAVAGLHTTFKIMDRTTGKQVGRTRHIVHDDNMLQDSD
jgi:hypothetical protein